MDVCFTPDSQGLLVIPRHNPCIVMLLKLPIKDDRILNNSDSLPFRNTSASIFQVPRSQPINFEPRTAGPLCLFGPTVNVFGKPLEMSHIESNEYYKDEDLDEEDEEEEEDSGFHFITWNDEGTGDYCLWHVSSQYNEYIYHCYPRLLSNVHDEYWLEDPNTPKTNILQVKFHQYNLLCFLIERQGYSKQNANGIGMQMVQLPEEFVDTELETNTDGGITLPQVNIQSIVQWKKTEKHLHPSSFPGSCWYKIADNSLDKADILTMKWTNPLMLGSLPSVGVIVKGVGLFELVDFCYASKFQDNGKIEDFSQSATNFCQLYQNYRFWTTNNGTLRVLVVC